MDILREAPEARHGNNAGVENWIEIATVVLLSIAVLSTAYCAWQSTRWGGLQTLRYAEATTARVESVKAFTEADLQLAYDANTFVELAIVFFEGDTQTARRLAGLFIRDEFRPHVEEWFAANPLENPNAPNSPFELENYSNAKLEEALRFEDDADRKIGQARQANQNSDDYVLATVYFALVLFFAGVATKFRNLNIRIVLLAFAGIGLIAGFIRIITLPFY